MLVGFALRTVLLGRFPLREDEAIYAYWALISRHVDPLLLQVWPDKPPIFIWLLSPAFEAWGARPAAAQMLNILASTLTIPVVAAMARRWWGHTAGVAAGVLVALSPFAVSFAPTAFTDPLLLLAGSLALCLAAYQRWFWSGLWLGIAIMTKQQGLLFAPLLLAPLLPSFLPAQSATAHPSSRPSIHNSQFTIHNSQFAFPRFALAFSLFLAGLLLILLPILYWDSLRWSVAPSPWDLGARNVGDVTLAAVTQWGSRFTAWLEIGWYLAASWPAWGMLAGGMALAIALRFSGAPARTLSGGVIADPDAEAQSKRMQEGNHRPGHALDFLCVSASPRQKGGTATRALIAGWLALWALGFFLLHVVTSVQVWDRYLLPLVLPLALLGSWAAGRLAAAVRRGAVAWLLACLLGVVLVVPAVEAAAGRLPIGGDHGAYSGLEVAFDYVRQASSAQEVVLHHRELGWHARFYLFDAVQQGEVQLRYYPHGTYLADAATKGPHQRQLVIVPEWAPVRDLAWQASARGLQPVERLRTGHFTLWELVPRAGGNARWRVCRVPQRPWPPLPALTPAQQEAMMCPQ